MSETTIQNPGTVYNYATRVDKVTGNARTTRSIKIVLVILVSVIMLIPVLWMFMTAFKSRSDAVAAPPKVLFTPSLEGFIALLTQRRQITAEQGLQEAQSRPRFDLV
jgi:ABC-type glycerol-3-phosphate transport system permease component